MNQANNTNTNTPSGDDDLLNFDVLTSTRSGRSSDFYMEELQAIVEEAKDRAEQHLEWLDSDEGRKEDGRIQQIHQTKARIAQCEVMIGSLKYILTGEAE